MKQRIGIALILATLGLMAGCTIAVQAPPRTEPAPPLPPPPPPGPSYGYDVGLFYDDLDPYGSWFEVQPYGYVWVPRGVDSDWRPYSVGRWVYSDYGWTWVSDEDFGWAVFHYGRWVHHRRHGWLWVPGTEWGPAWVAWRSGGGYSGWAPLPPEVRWRAGVGLDLDGIDLDAVIWSDSWCFVEDPYILEPRVVVRIVPVVRNVTVVRVTRNVTRYTYVDKRIVNRGVEIERVEQVVKKPVPRARVVAVDRPEAPGRKFDASKNEVRVFRPVVEDRKPAKKPKVSGPPPEAGAPGSPRPAGPRPAPTPPPAPTPRTTQPGGPPPTREGSSPSVEKRQAMERQRLEQRQAAERKSLEERQELERKAPPKDVPSEALTKRQSDERQRLDQRQRKERQQAEERRAKEKKEPKPEEKEAAEETSEGNPNSR